MGLVALAAGCGSDGPQDGENYGNLLASPAGLVLVEEEHETGWTRPECFTCHEIRNMHTVNRTGVEDLDLAAIRDAVQAQGEAICSGCHGANGVEQ